MECLGSTNTTLPQIFVPSRPFFPIWFTPFPESFTVRYCAVFWGALVRRQGEQTPGDTDVTTWIHRHRTFRCHEMHDTRTAGSSAILSGALEDLDHPSVQKDYIKIQSPGVTKEWRVVFSPIQ